MALEDKYAQLFVADKSEFENHAKRIPRVLPEKMSEVESVSLNVIRQSFDPGLPSEYMYRGFRISASTTDEGFWQRVDDGDRFGKGDVLFVDLEIQREFNPTINTYENKGYKVIKVLKHIPRAEQRNFNFEA